MKPTTNPAPSRTYRRTSGRSVLITGLVSPASAQAIRDAAARSFGGNLSAAMDAALGGAVAGKTAPATPSTGHHRGRPRTSPEGRHAAK